MSLAALPLPVLLCELVYLVTLVSLLLIVFVPFFPGVAVMFVSIAAYVGYASYTAHDFSGILPSSAGLVVIFAVAGMFSTFWAERLQLRYTYVSQQTMWGAILGSLIVGMVLQGIFWFMLGMVIGAVAMEFQRSRRLGESVRQGLAALYSMLGPRGFQLLMAMLIVEVGMPHPLLLPGLLR